MKIVPLLLFIASLAMLTVSSCGLLDSNETSNQGGPGIIIPGVSIDGIKLGDSRESVMMLLGEPESVGWTDGLYRSWRTLLYEDGRHISFQIENDLSWNTVDMIDIRTPYQGKTPEGISIGSTLQKVKKAYGEPDSLSNGTLKNGKIVTGYFYCIESSGFVIGAINGVVDSIQIYYHFPLEEDASYPC